MLLTLRGAAAPIPNPTGATKMDIWSDTFEKVVEERLREAAKLREKEESEDNRRQRTNAAIAAVIAAV